MDLSDNALEGIVVALDMIFPLYWFHYTAWLIDVSVLSHMQYLIRLDLSGNRLNRIPQFNPVPFALQEMDLTRNQITSISDLSCHKYLQKLCLDRNLIMKINGLDQCRSLTHLSLRNNGISKIENLEGLPLKVLDLVSILIVFRQTN